MKSMKLMAAGFFCAAVLSAQGQSVEVWTLERALEVAREGNPDIRIAQSRINATRAGVDQANAAFWPQLQFSTSYTRTDNPVSVFGTALNQRAYSPSLDFNDVPDADNLNVEGLATVSLYNGGKNRSAKDAARANVHATEEEAKAMQLTLEFEVARAFFTVAKTREFVKAAQSAVEAFGKNLAVVKSRFDSGAALKADVLDLEVRLAQSREDLLRARNASQFADRAFLNLLGLEANAGSQIELGKSELELPVDEDYAKRPELAAAAHRSSSADSEVEKAKGGYYPDLSLFGSVDYDRGWKFDGDGTSYTAGVMVRWSIWDGNLTRSRVSEARANAESSEEYERKLRLAIDLEVERARLNFETSKARLEVTGVAIEQAEESARLTRTRFEQGLAIGAQLFDAETMLTSTRVRHAEAEADYQIAIAAMRKAVRFPQLTSRENTDLKTQ